MGDLQTDDGDAVTGANLDDHRTVWSGDTVIILTTDPIAPDSFISMRMREEGRHHGWKLMLDSTSLRHRWDWTGGMFLVVLRFWRSPSQQLQTGKLVSQLACVPKHSTNRPGLKI
ncbi:hypothetical protein BY996DRAFT_6476266 [Phakopsora pachyrhizi]|nr:hypothetical protein BY996DRAFT_6476266 [Phakopsora pachyrhizi]